jgi:hypothetical protein
MKKLLPSTRAVLFVIIGVSLAFLSAAFSSGATISPSPNFVPTLTPTAVDIDLEIGSTDGIFIWAVLIALIIIIPILWHLSLPLRKKK